jgi:UTP--glucose-1-phosphate uridylyltransferase
MTSTDPVKSITEKMNAESLSPELINSFLRATQLARGGDDGTIAESDIVPVSDIPDGEKLADYSDAGTAALKHSVMIKLNGGLGTSMGLAQAKSLLPVKDGLCFLEVIAKQVLHLRQSCQSPLPLLFMNSFRTEQDTLGMLATIPGLEEGQGSIPFSFLQNKVPKLKANDFYPVTHPQDPSLEWCPPGHGDIYIALKQSNILSTLLSAGYRYAFVSNADNLGASLDINLLGYLSATNASFLMEVADRTSADKKGGHIAKHGESKRLLLREVAQTQALDLDSFQNIERHRYFNTNSLWLNLQALETVINNHQGAIPLPIIVNRKPVDPTDNTSTPIVQLESAMGAAIEVFEDSKAVRVARSRFLPVKKTSDLLLLMSDVYQLANSGVINRNDDNKLPEVNLDDTYFANITDFSNRFSQGVPSLMQCRRLTVTGDVRFGKNVTLVGEVALVAPQGESLFVEDDAVIGTV